MFSIPGISTNLSEFVGIALFRRPLTVDFPRVWNTDCLTDLPTTPPEL